MYAKKYETPNSIVLACCDKELIGKNLVEGEYDVTVDEEFYKGDEVTEEKLEELLQEADSINLFGKKTIEIAIKKGFLNEKSVIKIQGVEHAIILKV